MNIKQSALLKIALAIVIVAILISFFHKPKTDQQARVTAGNIQEAVGQVAVDQAAKVLGEVGGKSAAAGKILVILGSPGRDMDDPARGFRSGFEAGLKRHSSLSLAAVEVAGSPTSVWDPEYGYGGARLALYQRLIGQHPDITCIVSFVDAPNLKPDEMQRWKAGKMPKLISLESQSPADSWRTLIRQDILQVALIRLNVPLPKTEPKGPYQRIFDQFYKVVTAENLND